MPNRLLITLTLATTLITVGLGANAHATRVGDVTRLLGYRTETLVGWGLVYGLNGTGDGGKFQPAARPLKAMLDRFQNGVETRELADSRNVALVTLTVTVPRHGARAGDTLDVFVTSIGSASSLRGGRLFVAPLGSKTPEAGEIRSEDVFAFAEGLLLVEDPATPTGGVIRGGATMERNVVPRPIDDAGRFQLVIESTAASWDLASTLARLIDESEGIDGLAVALASNTVVVTVPPAERANPAPFIARVQRLNVPDSSSEARVTINDRTGTMVITGDVRISPVVISHKGLTITTVTPPPVATPRTPLIVSRDFVPLDPQGLGGARLQDLVDALDQLKVPAEDRITIVKELHATGKLHAKVYANGQPL